MRHVALLRAAQADVRRATRYYEAAAPGLGAVFIAEVERATARLVEYPDVGTPLAKGLRKLLMQRFPYLIIYRMEAERVLVLAVGHYRRHPDFWLNRL